MGEVFRRWQMKQSFWRGVTYTVWVFQLNYLQPFI